MGNPVECIVCKNLGEARGSATGWWAHDKDALKVECSTCGKYTASRELIEDNQPGLPADIGRQLSGKIQSATVAGQELPDITNESYRYVAAYGVPPTRR